jgi:Fe-S-cluster containining protein
LKFPCTGCGQCCRQLDQILAGLSQVQNEALQFLLEKFPYVPNPDGSCPMLRDGGCAIYNDRPMLCNLETIQRVLDVPDQVWFQLNAASCNHLIREAELNDSWLVRSA